MENFKEFQGKNLDSAIEEACNYFDTAREKLEIEIVEDAKSGIFGIVGARKAKVRARRVQLRETVQNILDKNDSNGQGRKHAAEAAPSSSQHRDNNNSETANNNITHTLNAKEITDEAAQKKSQTPKSHSKPSGAKQQRKPVPTSAPPKYMAVQPPKDTAFTDDDLDEDSESLPSTPLESLDSTRLEALTTEAVRELTRPIVGEVQSTVHVEAGRVRVTITSDEDSGLLIGREGQTLAALQYMLSRIVSRGMDATVRVQLDAGDYRRRQDEKLRETALALAEKARQTGRSWSTRPLSSYHRRIVHLSLQDAPNIQTRSTGEGPLKRVVIMRTKTDK